MGLEGGQEGWKDVEPVGGEEIEEQAFGWDTLD